MRNALYAAAVAMAWSQAGAALPEPQVEWQIPAGQGLSASALPYPADAPDGFVAAGSGRAIRVDGAGQVLWDETFGEALGGVSEPSLADLDGDGTDEIIVGDKAGHVYALSASDGAVLWSFDLGSPLDTWEMAIPADLDGDGIPEILAPNLYGWIFCLNADGTLRWKSKVEDYRPSTVAVGDIDNDGAPEIVYGTATRYLVALEADGTLLWRSFQPPLHLGRTQPLIADLDDDGEAEIYSLSSMIAPDTGLVSVNGRDGSLRWVGATWSKAYNARSVIRFDDGTRGIVIADKGNNIAAYQADGTMRWRTQVSGRGIWTPPAVADIDGDGSHEVVFAIRDNDLDGRQLMWYVLGNDGAVLGEYGLGGGFFGPLVADIDGDSTLEVVLSAKNGEIAAYTFGGAAGPDAVSHGRWNDNPYPLRNGNPHDAPVVKELAGPKALPALRYGENPWPVQVSDGPGEAALEVTTFLPEGRHVVQVFYRDASDAPFNVRIPADVRGDYGVRVRLLDLTTGAVAGHQRIETRVDDLAAPIVRMADAAAAELETRAGQVHAGGATKAALALRAYAHSLDAHAGVLQERITGAGGLDAEQRAALEVDVDAFLGDVAQRAALGALTQAEIDAGRPGTFAVWQDVDPWDNTDPLNTLPAAAGPPVADTWAFGNEIEAVCFNVVNLSPDPITLRIEPGDVRRAGLDEVLMAAHDMTVLRRPVWLPSVFGEVVPDLLPKMGGGFLIDLAPGAVQQVWIDLRTEGLEPGTYELTWPVRTLDAAATTVPVTVRLDVSPVALPEKSRFYAGFWSRNRLDGFNTVPNLNEHLQTIWYQVPLPAAQADAAGNLVGDLDWGLHDDILTEAKQVERILYSGLPMPTFPEGVTPDEDLQRTAQRNYVKALVDHLSTLGLGYEHFMIYVEDETGLHGTHEHFMERARKLKAVDPNIQIYANPWESITVEMVNEMEPLTDFWQPGMETIEFLGPDYVAAMRGPNHKPIATYTPPGNARILRPLGFHRAQAWMALHWGIEGGGWWVYNWGTNLWVTGPLGEPDYGAVDYDGRDLVDSRRWEAMRDGIEDFNAVMLLRERAEARGDEAALAVVDAAVAYVAGESITGMPREAADYDVDYATLMAHRQRIRAALERLWN